MVIPLQGKREKLLRYIFYGSIGWKILFHTYRLSKKGTLVHAGILSDEIGHNVSNIRKSLAELESMELITKTKLQKTEVVYISKIQLTPFGEDIAIDIYNIVKTVYKNVEDKKMIDETIKGE
jgi:Mn-dependent DtxR family transcriptional regulator